ncbi:hypothetical protein EDB86DRAFT_2871567 [Lactarius hatsudake]|nr:hypothetical protein EDB86DRAFT_2871567 [Lactarius hatsudake]
MTAPSWPITLYTSMSPWVRVSFCTRGHSSPPISPGHRIFIDHEGLNDSVTSTDQTPRCDNFRGEILARDKEFCVVTREHANDCDATHLIPRSKTDKNGVLLVVDLHRKLGRGDVAFLKARQGHVPVDHFTLHRLKKPPGYDQTTAAILESTGKLRPDIAFALGLNVDALFRSTDLLPPTVILDCVYGIAAYKQWNSKRDDKAVHGVIGNHRNEHYADIPATSPSPPTYNHEDEVHDPTDVLDFHNDGG